ncbi:hypothetical protein FGADI_7562 [Fusarium gaditjirri]|uniref:Carboxylesterase type B domain-containing protein n=1 Tax=Fusarium gaditjirri TaxID=282569 RepID=A0A8H4WVH7_9HYPO|nr:hypothetical protein FGADI_7562 [Fusarium gaditjirri]
MNLKILFIGSLSLFAHAEGATSPPTLKLPWGSYQAKLIGWEKQIYLFENVRFGAKPIRFGASAFPTEPNGKAPDNTDCLQINPQVLDTAPGGKTPLGDPNQDLGPDKSQAATAPAWNGNEDCLFLDVYVPRSVFDNPSSKPLPVTVWFYGGAYAFGTKRMKKWDVNNGPLYSGKTLIEATDYKTIFVAGNYRLGAFGWLAGSYMQKHGLPNAGLYDQNLLLQWVQKYIGQVHGDNTTVSAWGESAGGGSILHHLIRSDGKKDPLFTRFVTQSPAFEWAWDNSKGGQLDQVYQNFSKSLGCNDPEDISCIRDPSIPLDKLGLANVKLFETVKQTGLFPIGPSVDGAWIKTIPTLAFAEGNFWPGIKSTIVSHCANDAERFTPPGVVDNATFYGFLEKFLPGENLTFVRAKIANHYDCATKFKGNYSLCLRHIIRDASFTCNTRDLLDAYPKQAYAMNYGFPNDDLAYHASDLIPLFANAKIFGQIAVMIKAILKCSLWDANIWAGKLRDMVRVRYLGYFASFALHGSTDNDGKGDAGWPVVDGSGELFSNVMKPSDGGWKLGQDKQNSKEDCGFWRTIARDLQLGSVGWTTVESDLEVVVQEEL